MQLAAMRIVVMGAGAVGAYFGAKLARAGLDVVLVARGPNLAALRVRGVTVESPESSFSIAPVSAVADPSEAGPADLVLVCVKSYDTDATAAALRPIVRRDTIVLSLQNGIENEETLRRELGLGEMLGGLTHIGAELTEPGVVRHQTGGRIIFGELDGGESPRTRCLADLFHAAQIDAHLSRHISVMLWDKLCWNASFNATTAITGRTVGGLLGDADGRSLVRAAMFEVVRVARASGVPLDPKRVDDEIDQSASTMADVRTSMLQDLERGKPLEHDAINGAVVRAAQRAGVPAPIHRTLLALLECMSKGSLTANPY
jgi:2-dehydropantoate 2-reductase